MTVFAAALLLWGVSAERGEAGAPPPSINGPYTVRFAGYAAGRGVATVNPNSVTISGTVSDAAGNSVPFNANNLKLNGYRFTGKGTVGGKSIDISGRVDPPDANISKPRLLATYRTSDGKAGRAVGTHD